MESIAVGPPVARRSQADGAAKVAGSADSIIDATRLRSHVAVLVSSEPRRLSPGADGVVHLVLSLRRDAVIRPGQHFELRYPRSQNGMSLGDWLLDPPSGPSALARAFVGQSVYDNTVAIRVPVRLDASVEHGRHPLELALECDVYEGESGDYRGRYSMLVRGRVEVGVPIPVPVRRGGLAVAEIQQTSSEAYDAIPVRNEHSPAARGAIEVVAEVERKSGNSDESARVQSGFAEVAVDLGRSFAGSGWLYGAVASIFFLALSLIVARGRTVR